MKNKLLLLSLGLGCATTVLMAQPTIQVNPASLSATFLTCKDSVNQNLMISNTGLSDLNYNFTFVPSYSVATVYDGFESGNLNNWTTGSGSYTRTVTTTAPANGTYAMELVGGNGQYCDGVSRSFNAYQADYISYRFKSPVGSPTWNCGVNIGNASDITTNGAICDSWMDNGSMTVYMWCNSGTFTVPMTQGQWYFIEYRNINYTTKTFDYYVNGSLVVAGAVFWNTNINNVDIVHLFGWSAGATSYYDDICIGRNMTEWVVPSVSSGTVTPLATQTVTVKLRSTYLPAGTHIGSILVNSNDPGNPVVAVPCTLNVSGTPDINIPVAGPCYTFSNVMTGGSDPDTFLIENRGCDTLFISNVSSNSSEFIVQGFPAYIPPLETGDLVVSFDPVLPTGPKNATITVQNNDADTAFCVQGTGVPAPVIGVSPLSFNVTIPTCNDSVTQILTINNTGGSDLTGTITLGNANLGRTFPYIYIGNMNSNDVKVVHAETQAIVTTIPVGSGPWRSALRPDSKVLYVSDRYSDQISVINTATNTVLTTITGMDDPAGIAFTRDSRYAFVAARNSSFIYKIDAQTHSIVNSFTHGTLSGPMDLVLSLDETKLIIGTQNSGISFFDAQTYNFLANIPGGNGVNSMYLSPDGTKVYASETWTDLVRVLDVASMSTLLTIPGFNDPHGLAMTEDGTRLYVLDKYNNQIDIFNTASHTLIGSINDPRLNNGWDLAMSNKENYLFASVPYPGSSIEDVLVYDRVSMTPVTQLSTGDGARGMSALKDVFASFMNATASTFTVTAPGSTTVAIEFNGLNLIAGTYTSTITINSNDPANPVVTIPCTMTITAPPDFEYAGMSDIKAPNCLDLDSIMQYTGSVDTIYINNPGCDTLTLDAITFSNPAFSLDTAAFPIPPGGQGGLVIAFTPTTVGTFNATVDVFTNDVDTTFCLYGKSYAAPVQAHAPASYSVAVPCGGISTQTLTITNSGGSDLTFDILGCGGTPALNTVLSQLNSNFTAITSLVPGIYLFTDGVTGTSINDGGNDMYDGGNFLNTNLASNISYSDNTIIGSGSFGAGGQYFTRKNPGLFVMAADINGLTSFRTSGNNGADGSGQVDGAVLNANICGTNYIGFVKRVYNAGDPSINHLIIVEDNGGLSHNFNASNTDDDYHEVFGLSGSTRIYYLLYASTSGGYVNNATTQSIMDAFLNNVVQGALPDWLSAAPATGTVTPSVTQTVTLTFDSNGLLAGQYSTNLVIATNDPITPFDTVPVLFDVLGAADFHLAALGDTTPVLCLDMDSIMAYTTSTDTIYLTNYGCDSLYLDSVKFSPSVFSLDMYTPYILPGDTGGVVVAFTSTVTGTYSGTVSIYTNDIDTVICVKGKTYPPPVLTYTPATGYTVTINCAGTKNDTLFLGNSGGSILNYTISESGNGFNYDSTKTKTFATSGAINTFTFTSTPQSDSIYIDITLNGDFDSGAESASLNIEGTNYGTLPDNNLLNTDMNFSFAFGGPLVQTWLLDGKLVITLTNTGSVASGGYHRVRARFPGLSWLTETPLSGNIPVAGSNDTIVLTFNSAGLLAGQYTGNVFVVSNDPVQSPTAIPCTLIVTGAGELGFAGFSDTLAPLCLYLDSIMQNTTSQANLVLTNTGCDTLYIDSVKTSPSTFSAFSFPPFIMPGDSASVVIQFNPVASGTMTGTASVYTNDLDTVYCLKGIAYPQPVVCNNPAALTVTLTCNDTTVVPLEICNSGGSNLTWNLTSPTGFCGAGGGGGQVKVAVYNNATIATMLNSQPDILATQVSTYNAASLANYDVLMNIRNGNLNQADVLAWINAGGTWIGEWSSNTIPISNWGSITGTTGGSNSGSMSVIINQPAHYLATNINWASMPVGTNPCDFMYDINLTDPQAQTIVSVNHSSFGVNPLLVEKKVGSGRIILFNWDYQDDPTSNAVVRDMIQEVVRYGGTQTNWYCPAPTTGTVTAAGSQTVNVTFISTGQTVGTYTSTLTINSNDPLTPTVNIPVSLTVNGTADLDFAGFSDTTAVLCLNLDSIMELSSSQDTVFFGNAGCDTLWVDSIRINNTVFSLINSDGYVLPNDTGRFIIGFNPVSTGTFVATATLYTNDLDTGFCLKGISYARPIQCHNPASFYEHFLVCQDTLVDTLDICNTGAGNLNYSLWTPGGRSVQLDGSGDYLSRNTTTLPTGSVMTVSAWIKPTGYPDGTYNGIVSFGGRFCNGNAMVLSIQNNGRPSMATWCWDFVPGTGPVATLNQWNHIACVLNGNSVTLYMNGTPVSGTLGGTPTVDPNNLGIGITDYPGRYFQGNIDEVRVYNRALTTAEIQSAMYTTLSGTETGLMAYFPFDDSTGTDQSPNTNDVTSAGNAFYTNANIEFLAAANGTVLPVGSNTMQVTFRKAGLSPGIHNIPIFLTSNDPTNPLDTIMATLEIDAAPPSPTAGSNSPVCDGNDLSLTASTITGATYSWSGPNSFTSTLQNPVITAATTAASGTYSVTAAVVGCPAGPAGTTTVTINPPPGVPTAGSSGTICSGQNLSLTASTVTGATYSWTGPNSFTSTLQNPVIAGAGTAASGTYSVSAILPGCPPSAAGTTTVLVNQTPSAPVAGSNSPVCAGNDVSLTASTQVGVTYAWTGPNSFTDNIQNPVITGATTAASGTYSVTASQNGCTSSVGTTTVAVNPSPGAPIAGSNSTVCTGQVLSLTASTISGAAYSWTGPNSFTSTAQNPTIAGVTTNAAGSYSVTATVPGCPTGPAGTTTVAVNVTPAVPTASSNSPICAGNNLSLTASTVGGSTYSWTGPNSFTSTIQNPVISSPTTTASGNYSVTATEFGCTSAAGTTSVTVFGIPAAPTASYVIPACVGGNLSLTASNITGASYSWTGPNSFTSTTQNPVISGISTNEAGTYSVTATVNGCTGPAGAITVTVNPTPAPPSVSSSSPVCSGATLSLTASAGGSPTYQWSGPNSFTSALQNPTIGSITTLGNGTYSATVTELGCVSAAATTSVIVYQTPAAPTASSNSPICAGNDLSLTASSAGTSYSWTGPNSFTDNVQNPVLVAATTAASGTYSVTATTNGCTGPAGTVSVSVNPAPGVPVAGSNSPVCSGATLSLTASSTGTTYTWSGPNSFTSGLQNPNIGSITTLGNGTYSVIANTPGCPSSAPGTVNVTVNQTPSAPSVSSNTPVCAGNDISLTASTSGSPSYNWTGPNSFTDNVQNPVIVAATTAASGTYSVTATENGCTGPAGTTSVTVNNPPSVPVANGNTPVCSGQNLSLTASASGTSYNWSGPNSFTSTQQNPVVTAITTLGDGTYSVTASTAGCPPSAAGTVSISVTPSPLAPTASSNSPVCVGSAISLTASSTGTTYNWTGPASFTSTQQNPVIGVAGTVNAGTYSVTATASGCTGPVGTTSVIVNTPPTVPVASGNSPVCEGSTLSLTASTVSGSTYDWTGPNSFTSTTQNPSITGITTAGAGTYSVTATRPGCPPSAPGTTVVNVTPLPQPPVAGSNSPICAGSDLSLTASSTGTSYTWAGPNSYSSTQQNPVLTAASTAASGTYSVTATASGCTGPAGTVSVTVNPIPAAPITGSNSPICSGMDISLNATAGVGATYTWSGPNSFTSNLQNPTLVAATTSEAGTYSVTSTENGCTGPAGTTTVIVSTAPSAPTPGSNTPVCSGQTLSLTATATGTSYDWSGPNGFTSSVQNPTITAVTTNAAGTYSVAAVNPGCPPSAVVTTTVSIIQSPAAPSVSSNSPICAGSDLSLTATTSGSPTYDWSGPASFSSTTQNPVIIAAATAASGTYSVTATENGCTGPAATLTATVNPLPLAPSVSSNSPVCEGQSLSLSASTSGSPVYNWSGPNGFTSTMQNAEISAATTAASGTYSVSATENGCTGPAATLTATVNPAPSVPMVNTNDTSSCFGSPTPDLIASGASINWYNSSMTLVSTNDTFATGLTAVNTYTFYVSQTNTVTGCESVKDTVTLTIHAVPSEPSALDTAVCSAATIPNLTATGTNLIWYNSSMTQVGTGNSYATGQTAAGTYTYYVTDRDLTSGCESPADTSILTIMLSPPVPQANNVAVCFGNPVPFLTSTGSNVNWFSDAALTNLVNSGNSYNTGQTAIGAYTYWVTDSLPGCVSSAADSVTLFINSLPGKPTALDTVYCFGSSGVITSTGTNVQWYSDPTLINLIGTGTPFNTGVTAVGTYTYYVTDFAAGCGNSPSDTVTLTINPSPAVTASTYSTVIVQGNSVNLTVYNAASYVWSPPTGLSSTTGSTVLASPTVTTTYTVTGTNASGCSTSITIQVAVNPLGVASFEAALQDIIVYPNPAIDHFTLEFNTTLETPIDIYLINLLGDKVRILHSEGVRGTGLMKHTYTIDTHTMTEGVYTLEIVTSEGIVTRRVILFR